MARKFNLIDKLFEQSVKHGNLESIVIFQKLKIKQLRKEYLDELIEDPTNNIFDQIKYSQEIENRKNEINKDYKTEIANLISKIRSNV